jgi:chromate reductase, NAD(P)H dehydrogenase (quinone)
MELVTRGVAVRAATIWRYRNPLMSTFLAISGSLRADSLNTRLLRALPALTPSGTQIAQFDVSEVPLYNQDLDNDKPPAAVAAMRIAVQEADGIIFVTPEYNHTIPAVTKNVIDWMSRPYNQGHLRQKKVALFVASIGPTSGTHCLAHTKDLLELLDNTVVCAHAIGAINEKIAQQDGVDVVTDAETATLIRQGLASLL